MHGQIGDEIHEADVTLFVRAAKGIAAGEADQLDKAGQTILQLVQRAASFAGDGWLYVRD